MNTRVVYVLYDQRNQLCNPAICFAAYAYAHPIAPKLRNQFMYMCVLMCTLAPTHRLLPGVISSFMTIPNQWPGVWAAAAGLSGLPQHSLQKCHHKLQEVRRERDASTN